MIGVRSPDIHIQKKAEEVAKLAAQDKPQPDRELRRKRSRPLKRRRDRKPKKKRRKSESYEPSSTVKGGIQ